MRLAVIHFGFNQHANTGGADHAVQQQRNAAHYRYRNDLNRCRQFTDAGEQNGDDRRAADNPGTVDAGNRHHADVLTVGGVWRRAEETGDDGGETVRKHGAVQTRVAD